MKKLLILFVSAMFVFGMSSCKKDYTCTCTILQQESVSQIDNVKKGDAEDACDGLQTAARAIDPEASCSL